MHLRLSTEKANEWYVHQPWLVGCNFIPSSAINPLEMWQSENLQRQIVELKTLGRPLICTEWLARTRGCLVSTNLPVFAQEKVGCLNWGLVARF